MTWRGWLDVDEAWATETLPPLQFTYSEPVIDPTVRFVPEPVNEFETADG